MAKVKAPLFGFGASGQLAKTLVFGTWKGLDVAREYVVPANPRSVAQVAQRGYMTDAVDAWHDSTSALSAEDKEAWGRLAGVQSSPRTGFNEFCRRLIDGLVAGGNGGWFFGVDTTTFAGNSFTSDIADSEGGTLTVTIHMGTTKTFFPLEWTDVQVGGLTSFAAHDTGLPAGTRVYWYFDVPAGATYKRSGLYSVILI
jgi:hypothetical protein